MDRTAFYLQHGLRPRPPRRERPSHSVRRPACRKLKDRLRSLELLRRRTLPDHRRSAAGLRRSADFIETSQTLERKLEDFDANASSSSCSLPD
ncbi:hypothetical protein FQA47_011616 [Oryzias melastigma]|uniref:Uncharacterized protein n=1 Tax=Oryzias melastigma TaxID=30732 RepID=A0A834CBQ4_ORYME|nr:hypothetical protein FQA47_011616 [Oryzias melastigma]